MSHHDHATHKPHITPLWIYLAVAGTLLVMTGLTITAASIDFNHMTGIHSMNFIIAMVIATFKAVLVALFFMHLIYDNKFYLFTLISGVGCLMIFITLTLFDTNFRGKVNPIEKHPIVEQVTKDKFDKFVESHHGGTEGDHGVTPSEHK